LKPFIKIEFYIKDRYRKPYTGKWPTAHEAMSAAGKKFSSRYSKKTARKIWLEMKTRGYRIIEVTEIDITIMEKML